jgi:hypothetical protein
VAELVFVTPHSLCVLCRETCTAAMLGGCTILFPSARRSTAAFGMTKFVQPPSAIRDAKWRKSSNDRAWCGPCGRGGMVGNDKANESPTNPPFSLDPTTKELRETVLNTIGMRVEDYVYYGSARPTMSPTTVRGRFYHSPLRSPYINSSSPFPQVIFLNFNSTQSTSIPPSRSPE